MVMTHYITPGYADDESSKVKKLSPKKGLPKFNIIYWSWAWWLFQEMSCCTAEIIYANFLFSLFLIPHPLHSQIKNLTKLRYNTFLRTLKKSSDFKYNWIIRPKWIIFFPDKCCSVFHSVSVSAQIKTGNTGHETILFWSLWEICINMQYTSYLFFLCWLVCTYLCFRLIFILCVSGHEVVTPGIQSLCTLRQLEGLLQQANMYLNCL